jgi:biopolymer transport protein TolQ
MNMTVITLTPVISLSGALAVETVLSSNIFQMIIHAGLMVKFVLLILFLFSVISWTIIFTKWRLLRKAKQETDYFFELFWESTEFGKMYNECNNLLTSPVAHLFRSGYSEFKRIMKIQTLSTSTDKDSNMQTPLEYVERSLKKTTIDQSNRLERALSFLATTGNTTPFIGLFGTVWGIMQSFRGIGLKGSANLAVVAPGISEALIATAAGLFAAIPAVVAFNYFNSKVMTLRSEMDTFTSDFLSMIERQLLKKQMISKKS